MDKRIAIITGAAKGIGKAISERMVKENYITILVDVDKENGELLARYLGESAKFIPCDISNKEEVNSLFETVIIAANDKLVHLFLDDQIKFIDISRILLKLINLKEFKKYKQIKPRNIAQIEQLSKYVSLKIRSLSI